MIDLHLHTHHSDGTWSPANLVEHAVSIKLKHIAITDHDTVSGISEAIDAAAGRIEIIPGVEINTIWTAPDGTAEDVHILGYFIDPTNSALLELLAYQRQARIEQMEGLVKAISATGIDITMDHVRQAAGKGSIGRAHITKALVDLGAAENITQAYERFLTKTSPSYVHRKSVGPLEAIRAINSAGGASSIAHPGKGEHIADLIAQLKEHGLKGIEAYHRMHSLTLIKRYIRMANRMGLAVTGGSDCHGPYEGFAPSMGSISLPTDTVRILREACVKKVETPANAI